MRHHDGRSVPGCREKWHQIARSDIFRDSWNAGSTAQAACGFPGTPPAIVHAVLEFIWGMSVKTNSTMMRRPDALDDSLGSEAGAKLMSLIHAHSLVSLLNFVARECAK